MSAPRGALVALALAAAMAGCAEDLDALLPTPTPSPSATPPPTPSSGPSAPSGEARAGDLVLVATLSAAAIAHGDDVDFSATLRNDGADATYQTGGCGSRPFVFEFVAPNGSVVGPLEPDPRCLGPPDRDVTLESGDTLEWSVTWDGMRRSRDANLDTHAEPVPPGTYAMRVTFHGERHGEPLAPRVELPLRVMEE